MSGFTPEEKAGPIMSLKEVADRLKKVINEENNEGIQSILNSFEERNDATDVVNFLSNADYLKLIELQEQALLPETITPAQVDEYVSISDRFAGGLLCGARVVDRGVASVFQRVDNLQNFCLGTYDTITATITNKAKELTDNANQMLQTTANTYNHTRWFLKTVIGNIPQKEDSPVIQYIRNQYGHLLFTYDHNTKEFNFDDSLLDILNTDIKDAVPIYGKSKSDPSIPHAILLNKAADEKASKLQSRTQSEDKNSKPWPFYTLSNLHYTDVPTVAEMIENNIENNKKRKYEESEESEESNGTSPPLLKKSNNNNNEITQFIPSSVIMLGLKRKIEIVSRENEYKNAKEGGKPRRKTRRKIRRNKKAKTKKRKSNKKTKKRKANKKTKVNRKKSKKNRNKK
jgi:hypothetical protein